MPLRVRRRSKSPAAGSAAASQSPAGRTARSASPKGRADPQSKEDGFEPEELSVGLLDISLSAAVAVGTFALAYVCDRKELDPMEQAFLLNSKNGARVSFAHIMRGASCFASRGCGSEV